MSTIEPEAWSKNQIDMDQERSGRVLGEKEGEGPGKTTVINDAWTWTTGWGFIVGKGVDGAGKTKRENWHNCNRTIKQNNHKTFSPEINKQTTNFT